MSSPNAEARMRPFLLKIPTIMNLQSSLLSLNAQKRIEVSRVIARNFWAAMGTSLPLQLFFEVGLLKNLEPVLILAPLFKAKLDWLLAKFGIFTLFWVKQRVKK